MTRPIVISDIPFIIECLQLLRVESPTYSECADDPEYVTQTLPAMINSPDFIGHVVPGKGFMLGIVSAQWYCAKRKAYEQLIYVKPEFRKSSCAYRLITAFEQQAVSHGASEIVAGASTGIEHEATFAMYERLGYERFLYFVRKRIL